MNLTTDEIQAFDAVEKINEELYEQYSVKNPDNYNYNSLDKMPLITVTFGGGYILIDIHFVYEYPRKVNIYHSEDDQRIFHEEINEYENFYDFIKRRYSEIKETVGFY